MSGRFGRDAAFRSALLMTGSTYVTYVVGLLVSTVVARSLGPDDYGHYAYLVWMSGTLILLFNNGLTNSGMRFVSESLGRNGGSEQARGVHQWLRKRYLASLVIGTVLFITLFPVLRPSDWQMSLWLFGAAVLVSALAKSGYLFSSSIAKGYGIFGIEASTTNTMALLSLVGAFALGYLDADLQAYIILFVIMSLGHLVMTLLLMRRANIAAEEQPLPDELVGRIRKHLFWSIVLTLIAALTNKSVETVMLNSWVGPAAVGFFTIAATMTRGGVDLLASGLSSILLPVMSHAFGAGGMARVQRIMADAVRYYFFLGLLLAGVGGLWAAPAVMLLYGESFSPAIPALQVMLVVGGLVMPEAAFYALLSSTDHLKLRVYVAAVSVGVVAAACLALIPKFGLWGALAAHAASRLVVFALIVVALTRKLDVRLPYRELARMSAIGLISVALPLLLVYLVDGPIIALLAGALFAATYLPLSVVMRVWTRSDVGTISGRLARLPGIGKMVPWLERHARE